MNTKRFSLIILFTISTLFISSCATYHLTTQSLLEQFADSQKEKKVNFIIAPPFMFPGIVNGKSLREIKVLDSK